MMMPHRLLVAAACALLLCPAQTSAQIYAWRDVNGTLVLSDTPIDGPTDVFLVEGAPAIRTTRPRGPSSLEPGAAYEPLILEHAARQAIRPELVRAVIQVESGFNPRARSPKGAMGLMQLMPATAAALGVRHPFDPEENIRGGTMYLRQLLDRYDGDERLALAAYNAGAGAVDRHGRTVPPYRETRDYVRKVGSAADGPAPAPAPAAKLIIYKTIEIVGDRVIPRYSSEKPAHDSFEVVRR
jgi:hypothetical protein